MKTVFISSFIVAGLFLARNVQAQGTLYLSNLNQTPAGSAAVGNNSWQATSFLTGNNSGGYIFNSIQLGMNNAVGDPSDFTVMLYSGSTLSLRPGSRLATLNGPDNPSTAGIYTYTPDSGITLSPHTTYFIVLVAETSVTAGAYAWNLAETISYNQVDDWDAGGIWGGAPGWSFSLAAPQFALYATPVPEPATAWLLLAGGGILFYVRKRRSS